MGEQREREKQLERLRSLLTDEWITRVALMAAMDRLSTQDVAFVVQHTLEVREALEGPQEAPRGILRAVRQSE